MTFIDGDDGDYDRDMVIKKLRTESDICIDFDTNEYIQIMKMIQAIIQIHSYKKKWYKYVTNEYSY